MEAIRKKLRQPGWQMMGCCLAFLVCLSAFFAYLNRPITLTLGVFAGSAWGVPNPESQKLIDKGIEYFEKKYPWIHVEYQSGIQPSDYSRWLTDKAVEGNLPDVFMVLPDDFSLLAQCGALLNLDSLLKEDKNIGQDDFYPIAFDAGVQNKTCYALPFESNPELMFVNTGILKDRNIPLPKNGWSLPDFYKICKTVSQGSEEDGKERVAPIANYTWLDAANAMQCQVINEDGKSVNLSQDSFRQAYSYAKGIQEMLKEFSLEEQSFDDGKSVFSAMTVAQYKTYKPYPWRVKRLSAFDWEAVAMPGSSDGGFISCQTLLMGISANTMNRQESWNLLKTFCGTLEVQQMVNDESQGVSVLKKAVIKEDPDSGLDNTLLADVMNSENRNAAVQLNNTAMKELTSRLAKLLLSDEDTDLALSSIQTETNLYLNGQIR
ncbi:MAG: extracellular solute-binding protein [Erysipelotrichaceae bacterium]|nr:extracellular solute-binding protein [Erysipelotrichaceae bacterium]